MGRGARTLPWRGHGSHAAPELPMVQNRLFATTRGPLARPADAENAERAPAYALEPRHALAQLAATGCFGATFYADEGAQLAEVLALARECEPAFVAKTALWAREHG